MPIYEYECHKCKIGWEKITRSIPKVVPQKSKCPECGKMGDKVISSSSFRIKGKVARQIGGPKMKKQDVKNFYNEAITDSKERLKLENNKSPYSNYKMNESWWRKNGARKVNDIEQGRKNKRARELTEEAYKRVKKKL